jgi:hypothetical protein
MNNLKCPTLITGLVVTEDGVDLCNDGVTHLIRSHWGIVRLRATTKETIVKLNKIADRRTDAAVGGNFVIGGEEKCQRLDVSYVASVAKAMELLHARAKQTQAPLPKPAIETRKWHAENNLMPPHKSIRFHVQGEVKVPNPGVAAVLREKKPQGIVSTTLLLELRLEREARGSFPGVWVKARYDRNLTKETYKMVVIFYKQKKIAQFSVHNNH